MQPETKPRGVEKSYAKIDENFRAAETVAMPLFSNRRSRK